MKKKAGSGELTAAKSLNIHSYSLFVCLGTKETGKIV